ncbi:MAG: hypothetical protein ABSG46_03365, partial [Candidatus Binataceae bacterium]
MKRTVTLLSSAALALSLAAGGPAHATPKSISEQAPLSSVQGTWAFGAYVSEGGDNVANGTLTFNGNGGVTGVLNEFSDGTYCPGMSLSGSYVVNPGKLSGSASMTVASVTAGNCANTGNGDILTLDFYLSNNLKTLNYVETDPDSAGFLPDDFNDSPLAGP